MPIPHSMIIFQKVDDPGYDIVNRAVRVRHDLAVGSHAVMLRQKMRAVVQPAEPKTGIYETALTQKRSFAAHRSRFNSRHSLISTIESQPPRVP